MLLIGSLIGLVQHRSNEADPSVMRKRLSVHRDVDVEEDGGVHRTDEEEILLLHAGASHWSDAAILVGLDGRGRANSAPIPMNREQN